MKIQRIAIMPPTIKEVQKSFLYASIIDIQGTIRALDQKINYLMIFLGIPFLKLGSIYHKCSDLVSIPGGWSKWLFVPIISLMAICWVIAIIAAIRCLTAIDNPAQHIDGDHPRGTFFAASLFNVTLIDIFTNRSNLLATSHLAHQVEKLPKSEEEVVRELTFEQMKLVYIRTIKMQRVQCAYKFCLFWLISGGIVWTSWLVLKG